MEDLKIRVANEAESKEAQELLFELGVKWRGSESRSPIVSSLDYPFFVVSGYEGLYLTDNKMLADIKEITLQELRDMVNPMKEYLEKQADGSYKLVMRGIVGRDDDIEVPEWANYAYDNDQGVYFSIHEIGHNHPLLIWHREQDEPFLTPETTLNDQYAEIEQVRQSGMKFDSNKPRHSLLPKGAVNSVIKVLEFGAKKYDADNWQKVDNAEERYYNAAMRHIDSWWNGEKCDPETGSHHLAHAATNLFFLMWFDNK